MPAKVSNDGAKINRRITRSRSRAQQEWHMQSHIEREKRWVRNNRKQTVEFRWHDGESLQTQLQNRYYENLMVKNHLIHTRRGSVCHEDESENGWDNIVRAYEDRM